MNCNIQMHIGFYFAIFVVIFVGFLLLYRYVIFKSSFDGKPKDGEKDPTSVWLLGSVLGILLGFGGVFAVDKIIAKVKN